LLGLVYFWEVPKTEETAVQQYANKHRLTLSKAVEALVKKGLSEGSETPEKLVLDVAHDQRIDVVESRIETMIGTFKYCTEKIEKLEEHISYLQDTMDKCDREARKAQPKFLSDDEVSAMTKQRVQTVWEWRHGIRKPRGERILEALQGIKVIDGKWCKLC
jgi:chromosome segregation ATPase